jgi:hypothetical protein
MSLDAKTRSLLLDIVCNLAGRKRDCASNLLSPAGVPADLVKKFVSEKDAVTGGKRNKRSAWTAILDEIESRGLGDSVAKSLIAIAASWKKLELSQVEAVARGTVAQAVEALESMKRQEMEVAKRLQEEADRTRALEAVQARNQTRAANARLLAEFQELTTSDSPQRRGTDFEGFLARLFEAHSIPVERAFRRNEGAEQIDGAFQLGGWFYLVECRWRSGPSGPDQIDAFRSKVERSGKQALGMFLAIHGWTGNVVEVLKQSATKCVFLSDGHDLTLVLNDQLGLRNLLEQKIKALNLRSEPYHKPDLYG